MLEVSGTSRRQGFFATKRTFLDGHVGEVSYSIEYLSWPFLAKGIVGDDSLVLNVDRSAEGPRFVGTCGDEHVEVGWREVIEFDSQSADVTSSWGGETENFSVRDHRAQFSGGGEISGSRDVSGQVSSLKAAVVYLAIRTHGGLFPLGDADLHIG